MPRIFSSLYFILFSSACTVSRADTEEFNTDFLLDLTDQISVEAVKKGYAISPGIYKFTVNLNNSTSNINTIRLYKNDDQDIVPCLDQEFIDQYKIRINDEYKIVDIDGCYDLTAIPQASIYLDAAQQKLNLSIPQVNLDKVPKDYISPKLFDEGINAFLFNYQINSYYNHRKDHQHEYNTTFLLNSGFNYGAWRYRNQSMYAKYTGGQQWQTTSNKLERNILQYQARLELGDTSTGSEVFDSYNFRGIQLSSDEAQIANTLQRYAPVIRGIAQSNAVVEIRQNGYLIYSTNVSAGEFVIDDLYAANESGDLEITVNESNGRVEKFTQAYSTVPNMIRPNQHKYQFAMGQYRSGNGNSYNPYIGQFTYAYGFSNWISPYGGILVADDYYAISTGTAWSLGVLGAFSLDATFARNQLSNGIKKEGASFRFLYAKSLNQVGTSLRLIGYRYSTSGYYSLADAVEEKSIQTKDGYKYIVNTGNSDSVMEVNGGQESNQTYFSSTYYNKKNQSQVSLNQNLDRFGQLYFNFNKIDYWQKKLNSQSWQMGYNNNYKNLSYSVYYQREKSLFQASQYIVGMSLSLLLDQPRVFQKHAALASTSYQYTPSIGNTVQTSLSAGFLDEQKLGVQLQLAQSQAGQQNIAVSSNYVGSKQNSNFSYIYNKNSQRIMAGMSGGLLIHSDGVVMGKSINTPVLIEAKGAEGVRIENQPGLVIDDSGYAIISNSSAYSKNRVALKGEDLGQNVIVDHSVINDIIPTKMAIIKVKFDIKSGHSILVTLKDDNGPLITGAMILDAETNDYVGMVGLNGQAYLAAVQSGHKLLAKWGEEKHQQCKFELPTLADREFGYEEISLNCNKSEKD